MAKHTTVWIHDIPRAGAHPFHDHGKPSPLWHDFPARELSREDALAEGAVPCRFCFPEDYR